MLSRVQIIIRGAVQGVGFRPFIYRLAKELFLNGFVYNSSRGVFIEVEGEKSELEKFILRIEQEKPPRSFINSMEFSFLEFHGYNDFTIRESNNNDEISTIILPDIAVCKDCLDEVFNINDRRYLYPFTNCTNCGPRFSIIERIPYDRPNTSMKIFKMCDRCKLEYENPEDRRFHAQPIACPECGPHIELWDSNGKTIKTHHDALELTVELILQGYIVALKGLGGFQLIVDASNDDSVKQLRLRKKREEKPFALMFPNVSDVKAICEVSEFEERALLSPEAPIVLLKRKNVHENIISNLVAPDNPNFGIMMPYTPLHHILMYLLKKPIVATSGNLSEEPMCIDEFEALTRLNGIADYFLVHNRPIVRHVDDSILRIVNNREMVLRRARGYAPLPIILEEKTSQFNRTFLAVGPMLKNTIALTNSENIFLSQHIGDLSTEESYNAFLKIIQDFQQLYPSSDVIFVSDMHPDYLSTKYCRDNISRFLSFQHHKSHIAACYAENQLEGEVLGVAWDGTGYGEDGIIWGGEFFLTDINNFHRIATFEEFPLPGGELSIKEPRRTALGMLYKIYGLDLFILYKSFLIELFTENEIEILGTMLLNEINSPKTTSVGRIFDAVASLLNIRHYSAFEGQAAMMLEYSAESGSTNEYYPFKIEDKNSNKTMYKIQWREMIQTIMDERKKVSKNVIAKKFHNTLANIILSIADKTDAKNVVLSGGCFQNITLLKQTIQFLESNGRKVFWHQRVPPNDGGIALGQAYLALKRYNKL